MCVRCVCVCVCHQRASPMPYVPCLPHKVKVDVTKYHACHVKPRWMSQSATPATPTAAAATPATPAHARHRSQPNAIRALPATQSEGRCHQVPCLPRETKVDVSKCLPRQEPRRPPRPKGATGATPMPYVPRLPHKVKVDVTTYHACHAKWRWTSCV